ncbi:MAG: type I methionyl aminopeptidase [Chloroflexi bacterium]|nr:MAG: type I methionyl aminopeptidase [Phototrophicales bacterium]RMF82827.1 MAG: type I methionyl aminopeptidase [Chloroflexota bacterium]
MTVQSQKDLIGLMKIGQIVGKILQEMLAAVEPGITTGELDAMGAAMLKQYGARSAPIVTYNFPGATCISINDEAAHGIPGGRVIQPGDLVNIDVSAELNGYYADTGASIPVPPVSPLVQKLCDCAQHALTKGIDAARSGRRMYRIGQAMESEVKRCGFKSIKDLPGHGVGRKLHEPPSVPGFYKRSAKERLTDGLVITIEPFVSVSAQHIVQDEDGWTLVTTDGSLAVQYEHTVVITKDKPILLTKVD